MISPHELSSYYITNLNKNDGFGSQYQHTLSYLMFCDRYELNFIYTPLTHIEHNYDNDPDFIEKMENLMNIRPYFMNRGDAPESLKITDIYDIVRSNDFNVKYVMDQEIDGYATEKSLGKWRTMFWANKDRDAIFLDKGKTHVAVHIRRPNRQDTEVQGRMMTEDDYFLRAIQRVREEQRDKSLAFHIYSQGEWDSFERFLSKDTVFHIDEKIEKTFVELVGADILITCSSALSYTAAFLNEGIVYYTDHCHPPRGGWIRL